MQTALYELEMLCTEILELYHVTGLETLIKRNNAYGWLMK